MNKADGQNQMPPTLPVYETFDWQTTTTREELIDDRQNFALFDYIRSDRSVADK